MKRFNRLISIILILVFLMISLIAAQPALSLAKPGQEKPKISYEDRAKAEILIKYKSQNKAENVKSLVKGKLNLSKLETQKRFSKQRIDVLAIDTKADISSIIQELKNNPDVEYVQPNYKLEISSVPQDPRFSEQWGLSNTGQEVEGVTGRTGVDINAVNAWDLTMGSDTVIIGVLDTGIDINHQDLAGNIYVNPGEVPGDGIDNDNNGCIDDVHGWDFANGDSSVFDSEEYDRHGTQVAGIIAATANSEGVTGVAPNVKILPLKFISGGSGYTSDAIEAINYTMAMGVKAINCSFSGYDDNPALKDAMENSGILFVTAAGNRSGDIAQYPVYPSAFNLPNILSVAAIDSSGKLMPYSSFGEMVHVAAPGQNILSTSSGNSYEYLSGTSASAALVSGVAALAKSYLPGLTYMEIAERIKNNVVVCATLQDKLGTGGRVDAFAALTNTPPLPDDYTDPDGEEQQQPPLEPDDLDSWFTADELAKIKEMLHYGESGVNPATGNFSVTACDLSIPAPGFQVNISRTYNSKNDKVGLLGRGWTFGFEGSIEGTDIVTVNLPNGSIQMFKKSGSTYTPQDSTTYTYNKRGFLEKITDADQGVTAFKYDRAGRKIIEVFPVNYDPQKILEQMDRTEYVYDAMGRIKAKLNKFHEKKVDPVTYQWNSSWVEYVSKAFKYDSSGNLIKELDALGYQAGSGTTMDEKISSGYGIEYTYNLANKLVTTRDAVSKERSLAYTLKYEYDGLGRKTSEINAGGVITNYYYDDGGNITSVRVKKSTSSPEQTIETNNYDLAGRKQTQTDGNGNTATFEYNAFGKLRKVIYPGDSTIPSNTVIYQYDKLGNLKKQQNSLDRVELYEYDNQGRLLTHTKQKADGGQRITTSFRYDKNGNKRFETDGEGNTVEYLYDVLHRVVEEKATVNGILKTTSYTYDAGGNQLTSTDWRGNTYANVYDPMGRIIEKQDPYATIQKIEYNRNNVQVKSFDALNNMTSYSYDKNNRLLTTVDPEGHETSQTYDNVGNVRTKKDGRNNTTTFSYDEFNRLKSVLNAKSETTSYTYDLNGNMLTQVDGNGNVTTYEYNVMNQPVKRIDHGGRTGAPGIYSYTEALVESYTYYADGSLQTKTDRNGETTTYTYDIHGRMTSQAIASDSVAYTYDNNGNQLTMTDSTGTTTRTYDEQGRVLTKTVPNIGTTTFEYDIISGVPAGHIAERTTDPQGNITLKIFDKAGRLKEVATDGQTTTYTYNPDGSRQNVIYPNGAREDYTYYGDGLLKTLTNKNSDGSIIDTYSYTYDGAHNQTSKTDAKGTTTYTYDSLNRLWTVTEPGGKVTTYTYDKAGNRLTETVTSGGKTVTVTYTYNKQNRLITTVTQANLTTEKVTYAYDANGNTLSKTKRTTKPPGMDAEEELFLYKVGASANTDVTFYEYDVWNRLIKSREGDKTLTYKYNGDGLRVEKTVNGEITRYLYEQNKVILELDGSGNEKARNIYGLNILARKVDDDTAYYMYNGHADVTALINASGSILATYYYDAFGNILEKEETGSLDNPYRFAGYRYDSETDLYYLNARYYDSKIARFLTEDTYRGNKIDPLSLNLYTYCFNNPVMYTDPDGKSPLLTGLIISSVVKAAVNAVEKAVTSISKSSKKTSNSSNTNKTGSNNSGDTANTSSSAVTSNTFGILKMISNTFI